MNKAKKEGLSLVIQGNQPPLPSVSCHQWRSKGKGNREFKNTLHFSQAIPSLLAFLLFQLYGYGYGYANFLFHTLARNPFFLLPDYLHLRAPSINPPFDIRKRAWGKDFDFFQFRDVNFMMESSDEDKDLAYGAYIPKEPTQSLASNGAKFVDEVLNGQNERCLENFRMDKHIFYKLCDILQARGLLRHTNRIKIEEQLAIFMFIIGHNLRTRAVQELFRYSGETISRHFNNVLNAIMAISLDFFQPPVSDVPLEVSEDPRFYPYFKDCVGAVDGIHIPVMVGVDEQGPFRNKNGLLSQNVLAACSFDLKFHYVLAGWEGSTSDLQVLNSALTRRNRLHVAAGKYYLVDNKYMNMPGFLAPYHGTPYYPKECPNGYHPQDAKELFNQRHSLLRNATDCAFGALKARFPILMSAPPYPLPTQVKLVVATCALHNYIKRERPDDWLFKMYEQDSLQQLEDGFPPLVVELPMTRPESPVVDIAFETEELEITSQLRDSIASDMWNDYIHDLSAM